MRVRKKPVKHDRVGREIPDNPKFDLPARRFYDNIDHEKLELFMQEPQHCDPNTGLSKYGSFLNSFKDPYQQQLTFAGRLKRYNITLHECQTIYTDGQHQMALLKLSGGLPEVAADVLDDARSQMVLCLRCDGLKTLTINVRNDKGKIVRQYERDCPVCEKVGKIKVPGDKQARALVFEAGKLTNLGGGININNQLISANVNMDSNVETLLKMTQQIVMGERKD